MLKAIWSSFVVVALAAFVASCQTMTPEECAVANWRSLGEIDGNKGEHLLERRTKSCAKAGVVANATEYSAGFSTGVKRYCQPMNGFQVGLNGGSYANVCPPEMDPEFREAFGEGNAIYVTKAALDNARNRLTSIPYERDNLMRDISRTQSALYEASKPEDIKKLRNRLDDYRDRLRSLDNELASLAATISYKAEDYARARANYSGRYGPVPY